MRKSHKRLVVVLVMHSRAHTHTHNIDNRDRYMFTTCTRGCECYGIICMFECVSVFYLFVLKVNPLDARTVTTAIFGILPSGISGIMRMTLTCQFWRADFRLLNTDFSIHFSHPMSQYANEFELEQICLVATKIPRNARQAFRRRVVYRLLHSQWHFH